MIDSNYAKISNKGMSGQVTLLDSRDEHQVPDTLSLIDQQRSAQTSAKMLVVQTEDLSNNDEEEIECKGVKKTSKFSKQHKPVAKLPNS